MRGKLNVHPTTMVSVPRGSLPRHRAELIGLAALTGVTATMVFSIAAAQILLALAVLCWLARHRARRPGRGAGILLAPRRLRRADPVVGGFSLDPAVSVQDCKQLVLFLLVPVVYDFARGARAERLLGVIITVGAASAFVGIVQYGILNYDNLGRRMQGTLSHWMTYSGTLMLIICASVARLLFGSRDRLWAASCCRRCWRRWRSR